MKEYLITSEVWSVLS